MALSMALVSIRELSNKTRENDHLQNELHFWKGKEMKEKLVEITNPSEIKSFVEKNPYLLVDDGTNEYIIKESDLADYIYNRNEEINVYRPDGEFLLSTFGFFLNKISYNERQKIIRRLLDLQLGEADSITTKFCDSAILDYM